MEGSEQPTAVDPPANPPRSRAPLVAAAVLAVAAAAAWWFFRAPPPPVAPIPAYQAADGSLVLHDPQARFLVDLLPEAPAEGQVMAASFLVREGGAPAPFQGGRTRMSPDGAVRVEGTAEQLRGISALRVVVGRPDALKQAAARASTPDGVGPGWQTISVPVRWE